MPLALIDSRQLVELCVIHLHARLLLVRREQIDVDFERRLGARLRRVRNERAQPFAERGSSLDHVASLPLTSLILGARGCITPRCRREHFLGERDVRRGAARFRVVHTPGMP